LDLFEIFTGHFQISFIFPKYNDFRLSFSALNSTLDVLQGMAYRHSGATEQASLFCIGCVDGSGLSADVLSAKYWSQKLFQNF
jgi:hypothetical protein